MGLQVLTAYRAGSTAPRAVGLSSGQGPKTIMEGEGASPAKACAVYVLGGVQALSRQHPAHTHPAWPTTGPRGGQACSWSQVQHQAWLGAQVPVLD